MTRVSVALPPGWFACSNPQVVPLLNVIDDPGEVYVTVLPVVGLDRRGRPVVLAWPGSRAARPERGSLVVYRPDWSGASAEVSVEGDADLERAFVRCEP